MRKKRRRVQQTIAATITLMIKCLACTTRLTCLFFTKNKWKAQLRNNRITWQISWMTSKKMTKTERMSNCLWTVAVKTVTFGTLNDGGDKFSAAGSSMTIDYLYLKKTTHTHTRSPCLPKLGQPMRENQETRSNTLIENTHCCCAVGGACDKTETRD